MGGGGGGRARKKVGKKKKKKKRIEKEKNTLLLNDEKYLSKRLCSKLKLTDWTAENTDSRSIPTTSQMIRTRILLLDYRSVPLKAERSLSVKIRKIIKKPIKKYYAKSLGDGFDKPGIIVGK